MSFEFGKLTNHAAIADNAYFAQHAMFPAVNTTESLNAPHTPWIVYGGSLAGGQTAFSLKKYNDLFAGGIAASAPAFAKWEYPEWYNPILKYGPSDCTSRLVGIIDKIDRVIDSGDTVAIQSVKETFGLGPVSDIRDFAQAISYPRMSLLHCLPMIATNEDESWWAFQLPIRYLARIELESTR